MARSFNGSTDHIALPTVSTFNTAATSVSCWVNGTSFANTYNSTFIRSDNANIIGIWVKSTGKLACYIDSPATGVVDYDGTGSNTLSTKTWYHVGLSYDSVNGLVGYVNGSSDGTHAANGAINTSISVATHIGDDPANASRQWTGSIADVAIWSTNLSSSEFLSLANGVRPASVHSGSLIGYWPLDGYASPEPDLSASGNNGTLTGTGQVLGPPQLWRISA